MGQDYRIGRGVLRGIMGGLTNTTLAPVLYRPGTRTIKKSSYNSPEVGR
jgi:hypothetical protein